MSFGDYEGSRESGQPVQLFHFRYGTGATEYYGYTDHTEQLIVDHGPPIGSITYEPVPISRGSIESNGTLDKSALRISTDLGTNLAEIFRVYPPANVVNLTVRQGHVGDVDAEWVVIWMGRVVAASREHGELVCSGEPVSTSLRRPGLRATYSYGCRHVLYGSKCQANKAAATVSSTVALIDGATVTLAPGWEGAFDGAKFLRGMVEWEGAGGSTERRMIIRVSGDTLHLSGIPSGLAVSDPINAVLGCNHQLFAANGGDCEGLHDNVLNYGGFFWIPTKNPIGSYNNFY